MTRTLKILFTLSVILNVLLLGLGGGMAYKKFNDAPWMEAEDDLSPETKAMVADSFENGRKGMQSTFDESRTARMELKDIMQADQFDEAKFEAAMQRVQSAQQKIMASKMKIMQDVAKKLSPEERAKLAGRFMRSYDRRGQRLDLYGPWHRGSSGHGRDPDKDRHSED